jgi:hypothetical protein
MTPQDAIKDRGETDPDRCPDCWHDVEECICEKEAKQMKQVNEELEGSGAGPWCSKHGRWECDCLDEDRLDFTKASNVMRLVGYEGTAGGREAIRKAEEDEAKKLSLDKVEATTQWFDERERGLEQEPYTHKESEARRKEAIE